MIKQNINIVDVPILYNILEEIKENLSFKIENFTKTYEANLSRDLDSALFCKTCHPIQITSKIITNTPSVPTPG